MLSDELQVCSRCIYDERVPGIHFDDQGVCNYCHQVDQLREEYGTGTPKGERSLNGIIDHIRRDGRGKKYDCVVGVSGGTDSSYLLYLAREWGLRPLAVHYDNTWNSAIATQNISIMLRALNVDLHTHVVDNCEADDIFRAFLLAGVPEIEASTDLALAETMYRAASRFGVQYILEGHSFVTEGITPLANNYFDGRYISSIHRRFGTQAMRTYPLMTFGRFLRWSLLARIKKVRPFWYINYSKGSAQKLLSEKFGWKYYSGHHLENRMTAFCHSVYLPNKFNADLRNNTLAAMARNGEVTRQQAWDEYRRPPFVEPGLVNYVQKRLGLTGEAYAAAMADPPHYWYEFPTYKRRFELLRPLFRVLAAADLVPKSFYIKYCFPLPNKRPCVK